MIRKIFIVFLSLVLILSTSLILPQKKASAAAAAAWGAAVPAGAVLGAGAYTTGALALAGLAGLAGYATFEEEVNAHAMNVWHDGTDLAKKSLEHSLSLYDSSVYHTTRLGTDLVDFIQSKMSDIENKVSNIRLGNIETENYAIDTRTNQIQLLGSAYKFSYLGSSVHAVRVEVNTPRFTDYFEVKAYVSNVWRTTKNWPITEEVAIRNRIKELSVSPSGFITAATSYAGLSGLVLTLNGEVAFPSTTGVSQVQEAWRTVKDAGLVIPVHDAIPYANGQPLSYNPTSDSYTFPSGQIFDGNIGDIDWAFPKPRVVTDTITGQDVVAFPTRTIPKVNADGDVIAGDLTGTWTNAFTGDTVVSTTVPEGVIPAPPPKPGEVDLSKPSAKLSFLPLMMAGGLMTEKFPFSIPFDFVKQIKVYDVEPKAPVFKVNVPQYLQIDGLSIPMKFEIDLSFFDMVADILRWGNIVLFDIGLIFMIRRFMPD